VLIYDAGVPENQLVLNPKTSTFKNALAKNNIIVSGENDFKPARIDQSFQSVRIGLSSISLTEALEEPIKVVKNILDSGIAGYDVGTEQ